ncbi:YeiH family protein [Cytobacillus sp. FJAT-54145]|uniref:YeiH family protein n=1 Tax=Cytobacillus spartinae TaxID=3299023 RepID=A0ABW6K9P8_9BACI
MAYLSRLTSSLPNWTSGVALAAIIAIISKQLGELFPLFGSILFAITIGIFLNNTVGIRSSYHIGIQIVLKKILKLAIILLGLGLNLQMIIKVGQQSLLIILTSVILGILLTVWFGRLLKLDRTLTLMIGVGTSICGATAISCVKGILDAKDDETAYAISTIVVFNLIAFFSYPLIGHLFQFNATAFGIWAGTAVHDTSTAVAVGYAYGNEAGEVSTTVKLARTLFILPIMLVLPLLMRGKTQPTSMKGSLKQAFPWFILWFLLMSVLNTVGIIPESIAQLSNDIAKFLIIMVMAAVGLQVNVKQFASLGLKPFIVGLFASISVSVISLLMIFYLL